MSPTFRSLRHRNFRLFFGGQVVSNTGTWAQRIAQDWLVLELSGGSGIALGVVTALQFTPVLLLSLHAGVLADRLDKRRVLLAVHTTMGLLALVLGLLDVTGVVQLWQVYALSFALGVAAAVEVPVRQAFVNELVGPEDLGNALSLNSANFNSARILGPALAGVCIAAVGTGWVFLGNAVSFVAVVAGTLALRTAELHRTPGVAKQPGQVREGLAYVRARPDLLVPIALVAVIGMFGLNFQVTLSLVAKEVFGRSASSFGLLTSALALGSLLGALHTARRVGPPRTRTLLSAALVFGLLEVAVGLAPTFATMAVLLVPTGFAVITFTTTANAVVQTGTEAFVRGRVMALYVLVFLGTTPIGAPVIGAMSEAWGPRTGLWIGGGACVLGALASAWYLTRLRGLSYEAHLVRGRPHVHVRV